MKVPNLTSAQRNDAIADAAHADAGAIVCMRAGADSSAMTPALRDELLAQLRAGKYVELELELEAYSQQPGKQNRKFIRFRDGAMQALGRSGKGRPVLRDHEQGNALARGGTITASATEKLAEGVYAIRQTAKLTAPWAVELALLGLLDTLSIGYRPTGPVECSVCGTEVFTDCYHWRGDDVEMADGSTQVVEWVFTDAELVETSMLSVPAVASAHIESIRAAALALSAGGDNAQRAPAAQGTGMDPKLLALLGLAATAGVPEATTAVETLRVERDNALSKLAIADAKNAILANEGKASAEDKFISDAVLTGRIAKGDEAAWRKLHSLSATEATAEMAKRAEGCATPVGTPRQSANDPIPAAVPTAMGALESKVRERLKAKGIDPEVAIATTRMFSASDPIQALADAEGIGKVN